eukprot:15410913-Alexandrium_andersonii.AAC.1
MRMVRKEPYGVPPRPKTGDAPADGGGEKKKPVSKTPPKNAPKPKPVPAPADGGGEASAGAE